MCSHSQHQSPLYGTYSQFFNPNIPQLSIAPQTSLKPLKPRVELLLPTRWGPQGVNGFMRGSARGF